MGLSKKDTSIKPRQIRNVDEGKSKKERRQSVSAKACKKERRQRNVKKWHTGKVYNCIQKLVDILFLAGIIRKRKAKALEATAQSVSSGAFFYSFIYDRAREISFPP